MSEEQEAPTAEHISKKSAQELIETFIIFIDMQKPLKILNEYLSQIVRGFTNNTLTNPTKAAFNTMLKCVCFKCIKNCATKIKTEITVIEILSNPV